MLPVDRLQNTIDIVLEIKTISEVLGMHFSTPNLVNHHFGTHRDGWIDDGADDRLRKMCTPWRKRCAWSQKCRLLNYDPARRPAAGLRKRESSHPTQWPRRRARPSSTRPDALYRPSRRRGVCNSRTTARRGVSGHARSGVRLRRRRWHVRGCVVLAWSTLRRSESGGLQNRAQYVVGIRWVYPIRLIGLWLGALSNGE